MAAAQQQMLRSLRSLSMTVGLDLASQVEFDQQELPCVILRRVATKDLLVGATSKQQMLRSLRSLSMTVES